MKYVTVMWHGHGQGRCINIGNNNKPLPKIPFLCLWELYWVWDVNIYIVQGQSEAHSPFNKPLPLVLATSLAQALLLPLAAKGRKCYCAPASSPQAAKKPSSKLHNARARLLLHPLCHHCFAVFGLQCVNMEHSSLVHDRAELDFDTLEVVK